jgi:uncharacterized membrane protein
MLSPQVDVVAADNVDITAMETVLKGDTQKKKGIPSPSFRTMQVPQATMGGLAAAGDAAAAAGAAAVAVVAAARVVGVEVPEVS